MKCPKCQADNRDGAQFCRACGQSFKTEISCPHCGHTNLTDARFCDRCGRAMAEIAASPTPPAPPASPLPPSFAGGRYSVKKMLGEGGKKKVYLAHDSVLDRDVAIYLIKTDALDETGRTRVRREAQAMAKLGDHPNIASVHDYGDHEGQPYMVAPLMSGGDVEGLIRKAPDHKLPLDRAIEIARSVCKGLEFAHGKGIIHRDIKPGNVMLGADGTAKVNDFGLAVAVDRSRLTQVGMMVGTVSYMPPEQAMGGAVTARADLYSLGAMLYEMVTGRPPFIGDDSIAIIGQHINTPPVSPSWHRADLPPALETLIMQLLEKDPEKRPGSAKVVLEALDTIGKGKVESTKVEDRKETRPEGENPLYRRVFVGREPELKQLQAAFDGAMSGQGALMMVLGEPGIGKTALCEQLSTYVTLRGGKTLVGHCYEEGSLSLPYLAFVEAMRSYVLDRPAEDLRKDLGSGATDVARIVSEIREKLHVEPRKAENPEEDRYRLLQSVTSFLTNAAAIKPLLVVLEDLHDADRGTLEMLTYVSRNLGGARLLVVGTYRDIEVDRTHPLSAALAELRRVSSFGRVILRGLNADEVRRMLEGITRESVPWSLAEAVHRQTEGNPLFVQEVIRYLAEEGLMKREAGQWKAKSGGPLEMSIPEGLRDVIGKRVSLLSKECNQLLSVASVIGREFGLETLRAVAGIAEEAFVNALKEAVRLSVLEERSQVGQIRYRFTHAFFRQTLYEEMIAPERLRLHQQVARALEAQYAARLGDHAAELAEHFSQSTDPANLKKAVEYGEMAARRATDVYAYGEAVRLLDQAIRVQRILDPDDKAKRCDLLLGLCDALFLVPDTRRIIETEAPAAFALAESLGDGSRSARACTAVLLARIAGQLNLSTPEDGEWVKRIDHYARPDTVERAYADMFVGVRKYWTVRRNSGLPFLNDAMALALRLGDQQAIWYVAWALLWMLGAPHQAEQRVRIAEELWAGSHAGLNVGNMWVLYQTVDVLVAKGKRGPGEEAWHELRDIAKLTGNVYPWLASTSIEVGFAVMDGRLEDAMGLANAYGLGEEAGVPFMAAALVAFATISPLLFDTSLDAMDRRQPWFRCLHQAYQGEVAKASKMIDEYVNSASIGTPEYQTVSWVGIMYLEASILIGHRQGAELLLNQFKNAGLCIAGIMRPTCVSRHLGGAAARLGRPDEARRHYEEAIRICNEMRLRPELALTRLQFAELLLDSFPAERKDSLEHLDFAIREFQEMKMRLALERSLRRKEILKA